MPADPNENETQQTLPAGTQIASHIADLLTTNSDLEVVVYVPNLRWVKRLLLAVYERLDKDGVMHLNENEFLKFATTDGSLNSLFVYPESMADQPRRPSRALVTNVMHAELEESAVNQ